MLLRRVIAGTYLALLTVFAAQLMRGPIKVLHNTNATCSAKLTLQRRNVQRLHSSVIDGASEPPDLKYVRSRDESCRSCFRT